MKATFSVLLVILCAGLASSAVTRYRCNLSPRNSVGTPTPNSGSGVVWLQLDSTTWTANYTLNITNSGSPIAAAHIHLGNSTSNGPPVVFLLPAGPPGATSLNPPITAIGKISIVSTFSVSNLLPPLAQNATGWTGLTTALNARGTYVNIHTVQYPAGSMRCNPMMY